jgi:beta-phosphoglucomutase
MLKLVCFDLDGVLVDACDWHKEALNDALYDVCSYRIAPEEHERWYNGLPTKKKLEMLTSKGIVPADTHDKIFDLKQEKTIDRINKIPSYDQDKIYLLRFLKDKGVHLACVTNSIRKTANLMLEKTGIYDIFDLIVTNEDVAQPKPSPEGYIKALKHFNVDCINAMIVEDSDKGLTAANASGCLVLRVDNATQVNADNLRSYIDENFDTNGW